jgi:hypothetical protein
MMLGLVQFLFIVPVKNIPQEVVGDIAELVDTWDI